MQNCDNLLVHALLHVIVQMSSFLDKNRSGGLLCEEGYKRVDAKECLFLSQLSPTSLLVTGMHNNASAEERVSVKQQDIPFFLA